MLNQREAAAGLATLNHEPHTDASKEAFHTIGEHHDPHRFRFPLAHSSDAAADSTFQLGAATSPRIDIAKLRVKRL